ncbi:MAG: undecaprenyl-diphosphate phosphatase [Pseudomonadales bacterium]
MACRYTVFVFCFFGVGLETVQLLILALVQGVTEFLPVSSSAHLILPSVLFGWRDQGLAFDACVHLASLLAVVCYFRGDLARLLAAGWGRVVQGQASADSRLLGALLIASLPIIPVGFFGRFLIEAELRTGLVIATATILFALALLLADAFGRRQLGSADLGWGKALLIGCAQCLALIPGTSRAGIAITGALLVGFTREAAVRISFLLAIPAISGAAAIKLWDLALAEQSQIAVMDLLAPFAVAGVSAYLCIWLFIGFIERIGFVPFVIYRLLLGGYLLWLLA